MTLIHPDTFAGYLQGVAQDIEYLHRKAADPEVRRYLREARNLLTAVASHSKRTYEQQKWAYFEGLSLEEVSNSIV